MSLNAEQVVQVAKLAKLEIGKDQLDHYARQLSQILDMVGQLSQAATDGVQPMAHPLSMVQRLRADEVTEADRRSAFQAHAPSVQDGLFLVPKVLE